MSTATRRIRILIAGNEQDFIDRLRQSLDSNPGYDVIPETSNVAGAVRLALHHVPDVLLVDVSGAANDALDALVDLGEGSTRIRPVLLTGNLDRVQNVRALQLGARAVVLRELASETLAEAIAAVAAGQYWIGRNASGDLVSMLKRLGAHPPGAARHPFGLTARQLEITRFVAAGLSNREVAQNLGISEDTVKHHVAQIFTKTGASSRLELAMLAIRYHLLQSR